MHAMSGSDPFLCMGKVFQKNSLRQIAIDYHTDVTVALLWWSLEIDAVARVARRVKIILRVYLCIKRSFHYEYAALTLIARRAAYRH